MSNVRPHDIPLMHLISSRATVVSKWLFPIAWFGILGTTIVGGLLDGTVKSDPMFIAIPIFMAIAGFYMIRFLAWDLADTVYDFGSYLLVKRNGVEARIPLENIMNVSATAFVNPPRVTLRLVTPCTLGAHVSFSPKASFSLNPFAKTAVAEELMERAYSARAKRAA